MPGKMEFEFSHRSGASARDDASPFRMLVLADLSGRTWREADRRAGIVPVDFDRFDSTLATYCGDVRLDAGAFRPTELDDFRPETLLRLPIFAKLRELRARLADPRTFEDAAAELGRIPPRTATAPEAGDDSLEAILAREARVRRPEVRELDAYLESLVSPYLVPGEAPDQAHWIATVDRSLSDAMRLVLRDPLLRHFETTWTALDRLVSELELGETVELSLYDVTLEDLHRDFTQADSPTDTQLYRDLVATQPKGWSVWLADFAFGIDPVHLGVLPTLGVIGAQAGAPIVAGASPTLVGATTFAGAPEPKVWSEAFQRAEESVELIRFWQEVRRSPVAPWIALVAPRLLSRLPYGKSTDSFDAFEFEELADLRDHESLVWGNSAYAAVQLLAHAFQERGWSFSPGDVSTVNVPFLTWRRPDGEIEPVPSAETFLTDRAVEALERAGVMAVIGDRSSDHVRFRRFHSIADPVTAVRGNWDAE